MPAPWGSLRIPSPPEQIRRLAGRSLRSGPRRGPSVETTCCSGGCTLFLGRGSLDRPRVVSSGAAAESRHLLESSGIGRKGLALGEASPRRGSSVAALVEAARIRWDASSPPPTALLRRSARHHHPRRDVVHDAGTGDGSDAQGCPRDIPLLGRTHLVGTQPGDYFLPH